MKVIAQSAVVPKGGYVHLAYLSASQEADDTVKILVVLAVAVAVGAHFVFKLIRRLF